MIKGVRGEGTKKDEMENKEEKGKGEILTEEKKEKK